MADESGAIDVALIGGGIMSATLGNLLKHVRPDWSIRAFERLDEVGEESSYAWHNAGTGHAGLCELNYTPRMPDGTIDLRKALLVNEQFQISLQFWASLVDRKRLPSPSTFVNPVPHMSYVRGQHDVDFLRQRHDGLAPHPLFQGLEFTEDHATMESWVPLMMEGRTWDAPVAMTRTSEGTDVNYGALAKHLFAGLRQQEVEVVTNTEVTDLKRVANDRWLVRARDRASGEETTTTARFVFIGAGGKAIRLLQKSGIPEGKGYGGFPVSGQFLRCTNPQLIERHRGKVYGKSQAEAPPMAMPHLDRRMIEGKPGLLFGPYAGFSPKLLKQGSNLDLLRSVKLDNVMTMLSVAVNEFALTKYLIGQIRLKHDDRIDILRDFVPTVRAGDWELIHAGQRVQTMKRTARKRGELVFGTEVVSSRDGSIAALMGASPGASTAAAIMLDVMRRCFPSDFASWVPALRELIPSVDISLDENPMMLADVRSHYEQTLGLQSHDAMSVAG